jgi:PAS domain-containing protein
VVLYDCGTWSLTLREEHRLRAFENKVLRRIFGLKRVEVKDGRIQLCNEELCDLYCSPDIIRMIKLRRMKWVGHVAQMEKNTYRFLVGRPEGRRPLRRQRGSWVANKMNLGEIGWDYVYSIVSGSG